MCIVFGIKANKVISCITRFHDSNYVGDLDYRRTSTYYSFRLGVRSSIISWLENLQPTITLSKIYAE